MKLHGLFFVRRLFEDSRGQTMMLVALGMSAMIGLAGVTLDLGNGYLAYQKLLTSTNAAVLAGAQALPNTTTAAANVQLYSAMAGQLNATLTLQNASVTTTFSCLTSAQTSLYIPCIASTGTTSGNFNAMVVTQQAQVPTWFGRLFGVPYFNLKATATAVPRGTAPLNVAIILDATLSQNSTDDNCVVNGTSQSELQCELNGVRSLLQELYPCAPTYTTCVQSNGVSTKSVDRVAIFTFPAVTANSAYIDAGCSSTPVTSTGASSWVSKHGGSQGSNGNTGWNIGSGSTASYGVFDMDGGSVSTYSFQGASGNNTGAWPYWPIAAQYLSPGSGATSYSPGTGTASTYEVSLGLGTGDANGFFSDYRTQNLFNTVAASRPLNTSSLLVMLAGGGTGGSGCASVSTANGGPATAPSGGIATPNYDGNYGTFYAGVLYAAQAALTAEQAANTGSNNVIIILTDGNANSSGSQLGGTLSGTNSCGQAVTAAQYATGKGTTVYSVAYGSELTGCTNDNDGYTPCKTMQMMASGATMGTQSQYFYSDYNQSGNINTTCTSTFNPNDTSIANIFSNIGLALSGRARLIPNGST